MSLRKLYTAELAAEQSEMCGTCSLTDLASPCVFHRSSWKAEGGGCGAQGITSLYVVTFAFPLALSRQLCLLSCGAGLEASTELTVRVRSIFDILQISTEQIPHRVRGIGYLAWHIIFLFMFFSGVALYCARPVDS